MKKGSILLLALGIIVLVAAFVLYARRPGSPIASPAGGGPSRAGQPAGRAGGQQRTLAYFGITGGPSQTDPRGLLVTGFVSPPEQSPLKVVGVKEGDVILSCNGETHQMGERLYAAIEGLEQRGQKITLVVLRDGKQVTLARTEKLPAAATARGQSK
jgi:S1-C subfamily serine protease